MLLIDSFGDWKISNQSIFRSFCDSLSLSSTHFHFCLKVWAPISSSISGSFSLPAIIDYLSGVQQVSLLSFVFLSFSFTFSLESFRPWIGLSLSLSLSLSHFVLSPVSHYVIGSLHYLSVTCDSYAFSLLNCFVYWSDRKLSLMTHFRVLELSLSPSPSNFSLRLEFLHRLEPLTYSEQNILYFKNQRFVRCKTISPVISLRIHFQNKHRRHSASCSITPKGVIKTGHCLLYRSTTTSTTIQAVQSGDIRPKRTKDIIFQVRIRLRGKVCVISALIFSQLSLSQASLTYSQAHLQLEHHRHQTIR